MESMEVVIKEMALQMCKFEADIKSQKKEKSKVNQETSLLKISGEENKLIKDQNKHENNHAVT